MKKGFLLSFASLVLLLSAAEASFFFWFPRVFPTNFAMWMTDEALHPLLQASKKNIFPSHYIALLGDSYAAGMGDWATEAMNKPMARYSSADLLHEATGMDVVSFGSAGAGSVRGIVTEPVTQLTYLRKYINVQLESPEWVLIYFYEGNDLYDNAAYFHYSFPKLFDIDKQFNEKTYQQYLKEFAIERDETMRIAVANDRLKHWPLLDQLNQLFRLLMGLPQRSIVEKDTAFDPPWIFGGASTKSPGVINKALVDKKTVQLPDALQGPALALTEMEWKQAWYAFDQSLQYARKALPNSQMVLVYIPSVLSIYDLQSREVSVQTYERRATVFPAQQMVTQSTLMRSTFQTLAAKHQIPVIDTTDALRMAGKQELQHGPNDWNHLNETGYRTLSNAILQQLEPLLARMSKQAVVIKQPPKS